MGPFSSFLFEKMMTPVRAFGCITKGDSVSGGVLKSEGGCMWATGKSTQYCHRIRFKEWWRRTEVGLTFKGKVHLTISCKCRKPLTSGGRHRRHSRHVVRWEQMSEVLDLPTWVTELGELTAGINTGRLLGKLSSENHLP